MHFFSQIFKPNKKGVFSQTVILAVVFGFLAGVVGQIVTDVYFDPWPDNYLINNLNSNLNTAPAIPELTKVKRFLGIQQDFEVNTALNKVQPALVGIYLKKPASRELDSQIYLTKDLQVNGFILTSDGWLISFGKIFSNTPVDQLVVLFNQEIFVVEKLVIDQVSGIVFLKIAGNNLPVVSLGDSTELVLGQLALVLNQSGEAVVTNIKNLNYRPVKSFNQLIVSSEEYNKSILLVHSLVNNYLGGPLFNLAGEVIGIIKETSQDNEPAVAIPINQIRFIINEVLKNNLVKRPSLGVTYLDLAFSPGLSDNFSQGFKRGALVSRLPKDNSPAKKADIKINDLILSVDGQLVNQDNSLTDLIQQYQPGDEINLEIFRAGQTINQPVILGTLAQ